ncbi:MAG: PIN domain-containing protein [Solirubrobacteraceae bacterium]
MLRDCGSRSASRPTCTADGSPWLHQAGDQRGASRRAGPFMTDYGIASYDAIHAASAIAAGAEAIVTTDTGFAFLPSSLLADNTDRSRLASCRNKRPH